MSFKSGILSNLARRAFLRLLKMPLVPIIIGLSKIVAQIHDTPPGDGVGMVIKTGTVNL